MATLPTYTAPKLKEVPNNINTPAYNPTDDINSLKQAQRDATIAALEAKRQQSLNNLQSEQNKLAPAYNQKRSDTSVQSQLNAKSFAEFMAGRGQNNPNAQSGTMNQAEISRLGRLQGSIGTLNADEANANADIERRRSDLNNAFENDKFGALANIESQATSQLINARQNQNSLDRADALNMMNWRRADIQNMNNWETENAKNQYNNDLANYNNELAVKKAQEDRQQKALELGGYYQNPITGQVERTVQGSLADNTMYKTKMDLVNEDRKAQNETNKAQIEAETKQYGYPLSDTARSYMTAYNNAIQNPNVRVYVQDALQNGDIRGYQNQLIKDFGGVNDAELQIILDALEGARINKIMQNPVALAQYGAEYGLSSPKIAMDALTYITNQADSIIKQAQASTANEFEAMKLEKAKVDLANGNIDNYIKNIEATYTEPKLKQDLINLGLQGQNIINTMENRNAQTAISQQNANTSAWSAQDASARGWANVDISRANSNRSQSQYSDKQDENTYNDLDKYIQNTYTSEGEDGRKIVMSTRDKQDIGAYLDGLATQGVSVNVIKGLRAKYNIGN
jgi:hypothetical protein